MKNEKSFCCLYKAFLYLSKGVKGTVTDFTMGVHGTVSNSGIWFT